MNIYVGNLPHATTQEALEQGFHSLEPWQAPEILYRPGKPVGHVVLALLICQTMTKLKQLSLK